MPSVIVCCLRNLQENRHGTLLDELVEMGHEVSLDRCLNQCVGCRRGPALSMDGIWIGSTSEALLRQELEPKLFPDGKPLV
ncbi:hypothetical protein A8990_101406 [Paenibacillus taihuensis]|uniref:DUF1450 domain-containing protein n=1 Tax=Paenibacillus taihuensis TaxID=1156355 RepID=A0A3D9SJR8_9BACL|nr:hypothetical protein [Paenibacillus taihuensis]REE94610.1 hypothetical protein A8990_101406 [Paenibacillus taihuensis]